jgi:2-polyprenyl-3-methyl-5-hydroxy-6-metoxy-1,4-benzoquinol methylase
VADQRPRWFTDHGADHAKWYIDRFRTMAADGADLDGEARLVDAMVGRGARILDAGCGTGRVSAALAQRGHTVVGVDVDPQLVAAARADYPGPRYEVADLATLDLAGEAPFDAAVLAGNVLVFVAPRSERQVLDRVRAHIRPDGFIVVGFATDREYRVPEFDADCEAVGLILEHRFATWDLRPWRSDAGWQVSVLRVPMG